MPIVNSAPRVDPPRSRECRPTYVRAIGTATAAAPTATAAVTYHTAVAVAIAYVAAATLAGAVTFSRRDVTAEPQSARRERRRPIC